MARNVPKRQKFDHIFHFCDRIIGSKFSRDEKSHLEVIWEEKSISATTYIMFAVAFLSCSSKNVENSIVHHLRVNLEKHQFLWSHICLLWSHFLSTYSESFSLAYKYEPHNQIRGLDGSKQRKTLLNVYYDAFQWFLKILKAVNHLMHLGYLD